MFTHYTNKTGTGTKFRIIACLYTLYDITDSEYLNKFHRLSSNDSHKTEIKKITSKRITAMSIYVSVCASICMLMDSMI